MAILAYLIATAIPLVALFVIYKLDFFKTGEFHFVLLCFFSGGAAFAAAAWINIAMVNAGLVSPTNMVRFSAPIVEEILKAVFLLYLVRRPNFTYFVDGAVYGFAAGIGFAIFENYQYLINAGGTGLSIAIGRVISTNLIHASATAVTGIVLGFARFKRGYWKYLLLALGLALAMILHIMFNNLVTRVSSGMLIVYAAALGFGGAISIALAMRQGLKEEKTWIEQSLGEADRVTSGEAAVVQRLEESRKLLAPLAERFGSQKSDQIEKFLFIQARLGIQRKTLEKLTDEKMRHAVERQMAELRQEMDAARRAVGSYAMLYLRHTIPPDTSPLWNRLETLIQERASARPATGGPSVFDMIGKRAQKQSNASTETEAKP